MRHVSENLAQTRLPPVNGGQRYSLGAFRDATARRANEETLRSQIDELKRWQGLTLDREDRVMELKREVNELLAQQGLKPRYASAK